MFGKLLSRLTQAINYLLALLPYPQDEVRLAVNYVGAELGNCGIACVAMVAPGTSVVELIGKYKRQPYFREPIGWNHHHLIEILEKHQVRAARRILLNIVCLRRVLKQGKPVIVSLRVPHPDDLSSEPVYSSINPMAKKMGHLCVLSGFDSNGFYLSDPRNIKDYAENVFVPYRIFCKIFSGNGIVVDVNKTTGTSRLLRSLRAGRTQ